MTISVAIFIGFAIVVVNMLLLVGACARFERHVHDLEARRDESRRQHPVGKRTVPFHPQSTPMESTN